MRHCNTFPRTCTSLEPVITSSGQPRHKPQAAVTPTGDTAKGADRG